MTDLVYVMIVFLVVAVFFFYFHMMMGMVIRPAKHEEEKSTIYECGEPAVGSAWIQFDVRYYVVALLFVIFDVEVAFFFPWAIVFGSVNAVARLSDTAALSKPVQEQRNAALSQLATGREEGKFEMKSETARSWACVAFADILVFF